MLPFRLKPVYKNYLWGGTRLLDWDKIPEKLPLAESWELAAHKDGDNLILDGDLKGLTLSSAVKKFPEIVSPSFKPTQRFPLMVKLIDSKQALSIQVHPDDKYALKCENSSGKIEMWYALDCLPDSYIYLGFKKKVTPEEFNNAIINNTLPDLLQKFPVKKGDTFFIPAGTVHEIGAGNLLVEVQQNSNITYRVYDFGRRDSDGNLRELHVNKALDVANLEPINPEPPGKSENILVDCENFRVERVNLQEIYHGQINNCFKFILCVSGHAKFECNYFTCELKQGSNIFIPANCEESFTLRGAGEFLITSE